MLLKFKIIYENNKRIKCILKLIFYSFIIKNENYFNKYNRNKNKPQYDIYFYFIFHFVIFVKILLII